MSENNIDENAEKLLRVFNIDYSKPLQPNAEKLRPLYKYEVHCYTSKTHKECYGHPENSYFFDNDKDVIKCLSDLVKNKNAGIKVTELIIHS